MSGWQTNTVDGRSGRLTLVQPSGPPNRFRNRLTERQVIVAYCFLCLALSTVQSLTEGLEDLSSSHPQQSIAVCVGCQIMSLSA